MKVGISACLYGEKCRYDGEHQMNGELMCFFAPENVVLLCPEQLGGLPTPRNPAEIQLGIGADVWAGKAKVVDNCGDDVTEEYQQGAIRTYEQLQEANVEIVILKERSPSCGCSKIYDGSFSGKVISGTGVAAAYFIAKGIGVCSDENWKDYFSSNNLDNKLIE